MVYGVTLSTLLYGAHTARSLHVLHKFNCLTGAITIDLMASGRLYLHDTGRGHLIKVEEDDCGKMAGNMGRE